MFTQFSFFFHLHNECIAPFLANLVSNLLRKKLVCIDSIINILLVVWEVGWYHLIWKSNVDVYNE